MVYFLKFSLERNVVSMIQTKLIQKCKNNAKGKNYIKRKSMAYYHVGI